MTPELRASVVEALYRAHPVQERAIVARLQRHGSLRTCLTAWDLAVDRRTELTDQNHVGGARFVMALARAASIERVNRVLDLGCGIGGSARILAVHLGCRVDGIDLSRQRVREANRLTALVGLSRLVHIRHANMLRMPVPRPRYDVLWGQGAWGHVVDKRRFLSRWVPSLRAGGRIALEEAYVRRAPMARFERVLLARLEDGWRSVLVSRQAWLDLLVDLRFRAHTNRDLTSSLRRQVSVYERIAARHRLPIPVSERQTWSDTLAAIDLGLLGYLRIVARQTSR